MRRGRLGLLLVILLLGVGCGETDDTVDRPFIKGWSLDEKPCAQPAAYGRCYDLTLDVFDHSGEAEASCRVYALDKAGAALGLDESIAPDQDRESATHEVAVIDGFTIRGGDSPVFSLALPAIDDEAFWRWQVSCHPGAQG